MGLPSDDRVKVGTNAVQDFWCPPPYIVLNPGIIKCKFVIISCILNKTQGLHPSNRQLSSFPAFQLSCKAALSASGVAWLAHVLHDARALGAQWHDADMTPPQCMVSRISLVGG